MTVVRRSLLFVPGADLRKMEKAAGAGADTLLFDLEDSVAPEQKEAARANVAAFLTSSEGADSELAVRVNAPQSPGFRADVEAVVEAGARTLLIPKCDGAATVGEIAAQLEAIESARGAEHRDVRLLALLESPAGVANALAIGAAARVDALCFGHADFSLEMGLARADASDGVAYHARCAVAIAAKACGVAPIDTVYLDVRDDTGFRADAELSLRLGFEGKLCIHPRQVELLHEVFTPSAQQIDYARRVVTAWQEAVAEARGVLTIDGKMIDAPLVAAQERVLERARRAGVP